VLVLIGGLLLLDNLGLLGNIHVWDVIWPLFLIVLGVWMLWGGLVRRSQQVEHQSIPLRGAQSARLYLRHGAGRLTISSGAEPGILVEGDFDGSLEYSTRQIDERLDVTLNPSPRSFLFMWAPGLSLNWDLRLSGAVPLGLNIETGASEARLDLAGLRLTDLVLKTGASSTTVVLPASAGFTKVWIESGVASVDIRVPQGVAARIRAQGGLSAVSVDEARFPRQGDLYQSPDFDSATNKVEIGIQSGVGSVKVI
jgi:hypothetical protein